LIINILLRFQIIFFLFIVSNFAIANDLVGTSKQILGNYIVGAMHEHTPEFIKYFDAEYTFSSDSPDTFSLTTLSSIYEEEQSVIFNQTSLFRHDDNTTLNIGLGYRNLFSDDKMIFGANIFYDREIQVTHQRLGLGIELLTSVFDLRTNYYESFSDIKLVTNNDREKALDGYDVRIDYHLPSSLVEGYSVTFFTLLYDWSESGGDFELDGYKVGFSSKVYRNLYVETGIDDDGTNDKDFYLVFNYAFKFNDNGSDIVENKEAFQFESVRHRMFEKVLRENRIIKVVKGAVKVKRGN